MYKGVQTWLSTSPPIGEITVPADVLSVDVAAVDDAPDVAGVGARGPCTDLSIKRTRHPCSQQARLQQRTSLLSCCPLPGQLVAQRNYVALYVRQPGVDAQCALKRRQGTPIIRQLDVTHAHPAGCRKMIRVQLQHKLTQLDALLVLLHEIQHRSSFVVRLRRRLAQLKTGASTNTGRPAHTPCAPAVAHASLCSNLLQGCRTLPPPPSQPLLVRAPSPLTSAKLGSSAAAASKASNASG